jgi:hypothetical protein
MFQQIKGLQINQNKTLASFLARLALSPVETRPTSEGSSNESPFLDSVKVSAGKTRSFDISFMRTVRVGDDGNIHNLLPGLGRFPLFNISSFKNRLPEEMINKGGMLQGRSGDLWSCDRES